MQFEYKNVDEIVYGRYPFIGKGSARNVYDLQNGYVAKVARNRRGIAQNKAEYSIFQKEGSFMIASIPYVFDDFHAVIMQKAEPLGSKRELKRELKIAYGPNCFNEIDSLMKRNHLLWGDVKRLSSWGYLNERPVLVDYGFTTEVRKRYY